MLCIVDAAAMSKWIIGISIGALTLFILYIFVFHISNFIKKASTRCRLHMCTIAVKCATWLEVLSRRLKALQNNEIKIDLLSPRTLEDSVYVDILKYAVDNKNVKNIAISGTYGSGKSSIIKTFEQLYPTYKCLNLSLAAFAEELQHNNKDGDDDIENQIVKTIDIQMDQLEYSLVQQFFYHVKSSCIPDSRFGRIHRWNRTSKVIWPVGLLLMISSLCYIFEYDTLVKTFTFIKNWHREGIQFVCLIISVLGVFLLSYQLIAFIHRMSGGHIKFLDYEVELQKDIKISVFNRYLDELIYLFQTTKYKIVVLEDLDRFKNTSIFTKLRELNQMLNQADDIGRRIVFVYALRDDIFQNSQERTKFFDFIIPVIPHTSVANSASKFVIALENLIGDNDDIMSIHKSFLNDVAPFIGDLRTIKAIVTDFKISKGRLDPNLPKDNLLAMIIYKNLCPKEFEKVYEGKGPLTETFAREKEFKAEERDKISKRVSEIKDEVNRISKEELHSLSELKALVVAAGLHALPNGSLPCNSQGNYLSISDLMNDVHIQGILNGGLRYRYNNYNPPQFVKVDIHSMLGNDFDYNNRHKLIELKAAATQQKLTLERENCLKELDVLSKRTMKEISELDDSLLPTNTGDAHTNLLNFLIKRGYIDERYYFYLTAFTAGILTHNDNEYLLSIKGIGTSEDDEMNRRVDDPKMLLEFLIPHDFTSDKILNFYIVHEIMQENSYSNKSLLVDKIRSKGSCILDFIDRYSFEQNANDGFFSLVAKHYKDLWADVENDALFSGEAKLNLFCCLLKYADVDDLIKQNNDGLLSSYLNSSYYTVVFEDVPSVKTQRIIEQLKAKFVHLQDDRVGANLIEYIYQGDYYVHNTDNIFVLLKAYSEVDLQRYHNRIYSAILDTEVEPLSQQIESEISSFVEECVLSKNNTEETSKAITELLNKEAIEEEIKKSVIQHNNTVFDNVFEVNDSEWKNTLFEVNKVIPSLENISSYLSYNKIESPDTILTQFINNNVDDIITAIKLIDNPSVEETKVVNMILDTEGIIDSIWKGILENNKFRDIWNERTDELREEQVRYLIDRKLIPFDVKRFISIGQKYSNLYKRLLSKYVREVVDHLNEFNFTAKSLITIANTPEFTDHRDTIFSLITDDKIESEDVADRYLEYIASKASDFYLESLLKAVSVSRDDMLKMESATVFMRYGNTSKENLSTLFNSMGYPFTQLNDNQGSTLELDQSKTSKYFLDQLSELKITGKQSTTKTKYKAYILKQH